MGNKMSWRLRMGRQAESGRKRGTFRNYFPERKEINSVRTQLCSPLEKRMTLRHTSQTH